MGLIIADLNAFNTIQTANFCQLAAAIVVVYDHPVTFRREVDLIWNRPWSLMTGLFLVTRYYGDMILMQVITLDFVDRSLTCIQSYHNSICDRIFFRYMVSPFLRIQCMRTNQTRVGLQHFGIVVELWSIQAIMQLRIYAMCQRSKRILIVMLVFFVAEIAATIALLVQYQNANPEPATIELIPGFYACDGANISINFTTIYYPFLAFESFLLALSLWAAFIDASRMRKNTGKWRTSPTTKVLVAYSALYFIAIAIFTIGTMIVPAADIYVHIVFLLATLIILATRFVLDVREPQCLSPIQPVVVEVTELDDLRQSGLNGPALFQPAPLVPNRYGGSMPQLHQHSPRPAI
ncbi:hypothetical protein BV22DRAFT_1125024 [Leucogyrophana mollusca]|uniref:Uncharacterized protein n=1 Tax=Leucogyrophana mollusca TaxID=85980 RepID=A0ACB8BYP7_9AGAM|nr:hypothetical protein BV22DRAFT_1125024 [Leucogyrophana mollusca]